MEGKMVLDIEHFTNAGFFVTALRGPGEVVFGHGVN